MRPTAPRRLSWIAALLLGGCAHASGVTETLAVAPCEGAAVTAVDRPTWAAVADYDRDGDADLLLLDVRAHEPPAPSRAAIVPLRATPSGYCQEPSILVAPEPLTAPRRLQLRAADLDGDGHVDLVVWSAATGDAFVLRGTGDPRAPFTPGPAPADLDLARQPSAGRWEAATLDARGRLTLTTPELRVAQEPGQRSPPSGRHRVRTPFPADYAVYLDLTLTDPDGPQSLVLGAGHRVALRRDRSQPARWRVLRLPEGARLSR